MISFLFQLYFGLMLTVAGGAKVNNQAHLTASLRTIGIKFPSLVKFAVIIIPLYEIMLGSLLIIGWLPQLVALLNVITFAIFLGVKIRLATRSVDADCGCFGQQQKASIDAASLTTSVIFLVLAIFHMALASDNTLSPFVRLGVFVCYLAYIGFCVANIYKQRQLARISTSRS